MTDNDQSMAEKKWYNPSQLTLVPMIDPESGFFGLLCSRDGGKNWVYEYGPDGKKYHSRDAERILPYLQQVKFEHILMKSPNGTAFYLSVNDDGTLKTTKVGE